MFLSVVEEILTKESPVKEFSSHQPLLKSKPSFSWETRCSNPVCHTRSELALLVVLMLVLLDSLAPTRP